MTPDNLIKHISQLCDIILIKGKSYRNSPGKFFRERKYIGSKERKFISAAAYRYIRIKDRISLISKRTVRKFEFVENVNHINGILATILIDLHENASQIEIYLNLMGHQKGDFISNLTYSPLFSKGMTKDDLLNWQKDLIDMMTTIFSNGNSFSESLDTHEKRAAWHSFPEFAVRSAATIYSGEELERFLSSLNSEAPFSLRVNTQKTNIKEVLRHLSALGIAVKAGQHSPSAIIADKRFNTDGDQFFKNGFYEIQDEGSQIVSFLVDANEGEKILDACAGAGGKSLHLADILNDKGSITATDISKSKLKNLELRVKKAGYKSINHIHVNENNDPAEFLSEKFDKILIDAPCSGSGTIRRDPALKYTLTEERIKEFSAKQSEILHTYSKFLKKGGIMIYATCSFLIQENEHIIDDFLRRSGEFTLSNFGNLPNLSTVGTLNFKDKSMIRLSPHLHTCDAFFIAKLKKI